MKSDDLIRGMPGHPTLFFIYYATIVIYTFATIAGVLSALGIAEDAAAKGWALGLVIGLAVSAPTALTGLVDWLRIESGTPLKRTATAHLIAMVSATAFFLIAAIAGYSEGMDGVVGSGSLILTLIAFGLLTVGGWLGGTIVFVHGMRVLNLVDEPAAQASSPLPSADEKRAEKT